MDEFSRLKQGSVVSKYKQKFEFSLSPCDVADEKTLRIVQE